MMPFFLLNILGVQPKVCRAVRNQTYSQIRALELLFIKLIFVNVQLLPKQYGDLGTMPVAAPSSKTISSSDEDVLYHKQLFGDHCDSDDAPNSIFAVFPPRQIFSAHCTRQNTSRSAQVNRDRRYVNTRQELQCLQREAKRASLIRIARVRDDLSLNQPSVGPQESHHKMRNKKRRTMLLAMNADVKDRRVRQSARSCARQSPLSPLQT